MADYTASFASFAASTAYVAYSLSFSYYSWAAVRAAIAISLPSSA